MKKIILGISLTIVSFLFFIVKTNATTEDWTENNIVIIDIEIDLNEMNAEQSFKLFSFLYDNNFTFYNGLLINQTIINNFEILKYTNYNASLEDIITYINIYINNSLEIEISNYKINNDIHYDFITKNYNNNLSLYGDIKIPKETYNTIYMLGWNDGENYWYIEGFENGYQEGGEHGWTAGYNEGILQGENKGFVDGYEEGLYRGTKIGREEGYNEGRIDGYDKGEEIGRNKYGIFYLGQWISAEEYANIRVQQTINEIGSADDNKIGLIGFIPSILGSIGAFFFTLASFEVIGVSLMDIIVLFGSLAVIILIIKLIKGGD